MLFRGKQVAPPLAAIATVLLIAAWLVARPIQEKAPADQRQRVHLFFSALDRDQRLIKDLARNEIRIVEGRTERELESLAVRKDVPLRVGLLFDASGSRNLQFPGAERQPAIEFLRNVLGPSDRAFVASFGEEANLRSSLTADGLQLETAITSATNDYGGSSALYDTIIVASERVLKNQAGRRILIVVTDGLDNSSREDLQTAIMAAWSAQTTVHVILIQPQVGEISPLARRRSRQACERLAHQTGGLVFPVTRAESFAAAFSAFADAVANEYAATYVPSKPLKKGSVGDVRIKSLTKRIDRITRPVQFIPD